MISFTSLQQENIKKTLINNGVYNMNIKSIMRRMRLLRKVVYTLQFKKELDKLPEDLLEQSAGRTKALKDKYAGKRCFIIGNGPSLKAEDLDKLKNEFSFASNRIYAIYDKTEWRPTFYAVQDEVVLEKNMEKIRDCMCQSEYGFVSANNYELCAETFAENTNVVWFPRRFCPPKKNMYPFSQDASKEVYEGLTITYSCMQMAAYMGFKEIYLLGVDHSYAIELDNDGNVIKRDDNAKSHFSGAEVSTNDMNLPKVVEMTKAYLSAEKYSRKNDFRVFNATRGGKLEVFERVDFDKLF